MNQGIYEDLKKFNKSVNITYQENEKICNDN